ncbi:MAG: DUF421 domain-containing protein [Clostridia bacterium]|nr:DUF421 domain-containing protein [Clostridia bacterium]
MDMNNLHDIVKVLIFSIIAYAVLFVIAKVLGKKQIAQLSFIDYVVGITIGSIAAEMATDLVNPFYHYIIAMAVFLIFDIVISLISGKTKFLKSIFCGKPLIIIQDGKIDYNALKTSKLTVDEIIGMARDKDYFDINDIAFGILETSGKFSVLPKAPNKPTTCEDLGIKPPPASLTSYLIIDGKICYDVLKSNNYSVSWLLDGIDAENEKDVKNILLASYDTQTKRFIIHYKNK